MTVQHLHHLIWQLAFGSALLFLLPLTAVEGALKKGTIGYWLSYARDANRTNDLERVQRGLQRAEALLSRPRQLSTQQQKNYKLWLWLMWSNFHTRKGKFPPFMKQNEFEDKQHLQQHKRSLKQSIVHLNQALLFLARYNQLLRNVARQSGLKGAISYHTTYSRQERMKNTIQIGQLRLARLAQLEQKWKAASSVQHAQKLRALTAQVRRQLAQLRNRQQRQDQSQRIQQSLVIAKAQASYKRHEFTLQRNRQTSSVLTWSGVGLFVLGLAGSGVGTARFLEANATDAQGLPRHNVDQALSYQSSGVALLATGGTLCLSGIVTFTVGLVMKPTNKDYNKGIFRSQKQYLDWLQQQDNSKPKTTKLIGELQ